MGCVQAKLNLLCTECCLQIVLVLAGWLAAGKVSIIDRVYDEKVERLEQEHIGWECFVAAGPVEVLSVEVLCSELRSGSAEQHVWFNMWCRTVWLSVVFSLVPLILPGMLQSLTVPKQCPSVDWILTALCATLMCWHGSHVLFLLLSQVMSSSHELDFTWYLSGFRMPAVWVAVCTPFLYKHWIEP